MNTFKIIRLFKINLTGVVVAGIIEYYSFDLFQYCTVNVKSIILTLFVYTDTQSIIKIDVRHLCTCITN